MKTAIILIVIAILVLALGTYLWQKRDRTQPLWVTILEALTDMATGMFFSSYRAWAVFLWLLGLVLLIIGGVVLNKG